MPGYPQSTLPFYDPIFLTTGNSVIIKNTSGNTPTRFYGFANYANVAQTCTVQLTDLAGNLNLPQIGTMLATQFVLITGGGLVLTNGLIALCSTAPVAPGIVLFVK